MTNSFKILYCKFMSVSKDQSEDQNQYCAWCSRKTNLNLNNKMKSTV